MSNNPNVNGKYKWIGSRPDRPDGADKVTGRAQFGADFSLPGMLWGKVLRSPHAHARIRSIDTSAALALEGVAKGAELHPLQRKFLEHAALQCGVCTPGFIVAAKALLERNPDPSEEETRYWLAGNLCRCTGYDKIVTAVLDVAAEMRAGK